MLSEPAKAHVASPGPMAESDSTRIGASVTVAPVHEPGGGATGM